MTRKTSPEAGKPFPKAKATRKTAAKPKATAKPKTKAVSSEQRPNSKKAPRGKPFQKGQSGNPGGRPKEVEEVRDLARKHTLEAIQRLAVLMTDESGRVAVAACNAILDRGWGKPTQFLGNDKERPLVPVLNVQYG